MQGAILRQVNYDNHTHRDTSARIAFLLNQTSRNTGTLKVSSVVKQRMASIICFKAWGDMPAGLFN